MSSARLGGKDQPVDGDQSIRVGEDGIEIDLNDLRVLQGELRKCDKDTRQRVGVDGRLAANAIKYSLSLQRVDHQRDVAAQNRGPRECDVFQRLDKYSTESQHDDGAEH